MRQTSALMTALVLLVCTFAPRGPVGALAAPPPSSSSPASSSPPGPGVAPIAGTRSTTVSGVGGTAGVDGVTQPPLPPARSVDAILTDMIAALGGAAAIGRHRSLHTKMEITFKGLGITGTAEHYGAAGDKALTVTEIPSLASTREGSDGTRFWSQDPINGLRLLEGPEAEQSRVEVAWNAELRMKDLFRDIEANNERTEDGGYQECLTLTPKIGPSMTNCFDPRTHLMVVQKGVRAGPQGDMPFSARLSDWRKVGDVKMAYATDMQVGPLAFSGRVTSVELDLPIEPGLFEVPRPAKPAVARRGATANPNEKNRNKDKDKSKGKASGSSEAPAPGPAKR